MLHLVAFKRQESFSANGEMVESTKAADDGGGGGGAERRNNEPVWRTSETHAAANGAIMAQR